MKVRSVCEVCECVSDCVASVFRQQIFECVHTRHTADTPTNCMVLSSVAHHMLEILSGFFFFFFLLKLHLDLTIF